MILRLIKLLFMCIIAIAIIYIIMTTLFISVTWIIEVLIFK